MNNKQHDLKMSKLKRTFKKNKEPVESIRQGQESDELLGYQFERNLHENKETNKKKKRFQ